MPKQHGVCLQRQRIAWDQAVHNCKARKHQSTEFTDSDETWKRNIVHAQCTVQKLLDLGWFRHSASKMLSVATASDALGADCWTENSALYLGTTGAEVPGTWGKCWQKPWWSVQHHDLVASFYLSPIWLSVPSESARKYHGWYIMSQHAANMLPSKTLPSKRVFLNSSQLCAPSWTIARFNLPASRQIQWSFST